MNMRALITVVCLVLAACCPPKDDAAPDYGTERRQSALTRAADANPEDGSFTRRRVGDLEMIKGALEEFAADHDGSYPVSDGWVGYSSVYGAALGEAWIPELAPDYIDALPREPLESDLGDGPQYLYYSNGADYKVIAHLTGDCGPEIEAGDVAIDPARKNEQGCWGYGVWSPGGEAF